MCVCVCVCVCVKGDKHKDSHLDYYNNRLYKPIIHSIQTEIQTSCHGHVSTPNQKINIYNYVYDYNAPIILIKYSHFCFFIYT